MAEVEGNPFHTAASLKAVVNFPGHTDREKSLRVANLKSQLAIPREIHKEEHIEERFVFAMGNGDRDWKKVIFSVQVTFSTTKEGPIFIYHPSDTRFHHRYSAIRARSGVVSVSCWGGFLIVEWAQSIALAGNSFSRNINSCWNAICLLMLGYYILMESFNFSRIIIQPIYLN